MKKIKMLESATLPGRRHLSKGEDYEVEDEESERLIASNLAEPSDDKAESEEGGSHPKRKKK